MSDKYLDDSLVITFDEHITNYKYGMLFTKEFFKDYINKGLINDQTGIGLMVKNGMVCEHVIIYASNFDIVVTEDVTDILFLKNI